MQGIQEEKVSNSERNRSLAEAYQEASTAWEKKEYRNQLIMENQKLVAKIANDYSGYAAMTSYEFEDLVQEGNLGLMHAIEKYDPSLGFTFATYAVPWIKQAIERAMIGNGHMVRIPFHKAAKVRKFSSIEARYAKEKGKTPTDPELSKLTGYTEKEIKEFRKVSKLTVPLSLSMPVGDQDGKESCLEDIIISDDAGPEQAIDKISEKQLLAWLERILSAKEYDVMCRRNAIAPYDHVWTLNEIGDVYDISRERVRQLEKSALDKARKKIRLREQRIRKESGF